jgi:hypothetical protein
VKSVPTFDGVRGITPWAPLSRSDEAIADVILVGELARDHLRGRLDLTEERLTHGAGHSAKLSP